MKGSQLGSGSIVGAFSVVSGKKIPSNTIWAGNPVRQIKNKMFWTGQVIRNWSDEDTLKYQKMETDEFTFAANKKTLSFDELDRQLNELQKADDKLEFLLELSKNRSKNRFAI